MDKLNLPIVKQPARLPRTLLMDEYLEFVNFNLEYTVDRKVSRRWKKIFFVNVPFSLK